MAIYTPVFNEIRKLLYKIIGNYISRNRYSKSNEINKYIMELKNEAPDKFVMIDFTYSVPYSDEVQEVLVDMVRHCLIEKSNKGYELTTLGKSFIEEGKEEWI